MLAQKRASFSLTCRIGKWFGDATEEVSIALSYLYLDPDHALSFQATAIGRKGFFRAIHILRNLPNQFPETLDRADFRWSFLEPPDDLWP